MRNIIILLCFMFAVIFTTQTEAATGLKVKNLSQRTIYVAYSHYSGSGPGYIGHVTKGWYAIHPGQIKNLNFGRNTSHFSVSVRYQGGQDVVFWNANETIRKYYSNNGFTYYKRKYNNGLTHYLYFGQWKTSLNLPTRNFYKFQYNQNAHFPLSIF